MSKHVDVWTRGRVSDSDDSGAAAQEVEQGAWARGGSHEADAGAAMVGGTRASRSVNLWRDQTSFVL